MPRRAVVHQGLQHMVADDDALPRELATWAVLRTRAIDELTRQAPRVPVCVVTPLEGTPAPVARLLNRMVSRSLEGGICGLAARVADVATVLTRPGEFTARIEAVGYLPRELTSAIDDVRRSMAAAAAGTPNLLVNPTDPLPAPAVPPNLREQFRPGRGVLVERASVTQGEQFTAVDDVAPAGAGDVPITPSLTAPRAAGVHVAGVPMQLPDQLLHRAAVARLRGRVQQRVPGPPPRLDPAAGALVGILGYWADYPSMATAAPQPVDFCALDAPLSFAHPLLAPVRACTLTPVGAPARMSQAMAASSRELFVAPYAGLNPLGGDVLALDATGSPEREFVVTESLTPQADPLAPARVRLRAPCAFMHRAAAAVQRVNVGLGAPAGTVSREALPGDPVLFATGLAGLAPGTGFLVIEDGTPRAEYVPYRQLPRATLLPAPPANNFAITHAQAADAQGWFEWPLLARVAQIEVAVKFAGLSVVPLRFALSYEGDNPLSILVS